MTKPRLHAVRTAPIWQEIELNVTFDRDAWNERYNQDEKPNRFPGDFLQLTDQSFLWEDLNDKARDSAALLHTRMRTVVGLRRQAELLKHEEEQIWSTLAAEGYQEDVVKVAKEILKTADKHGSHAEAVNHLKRAASHVDTLGRMLRWDANTEALRQRAADRAAADQAEQDLAAMGGGDRG